MKTAVTIDKEFLLRFAKESSKQADASLTRQRALIEELKAEQAASMAKATAFADQLEYAARCAANTYVHLCLQLDPDGQEPL